MNLQTFILPITTVAFALSATSLFSQLNLTWGGAIASGGGQAGIIYDAAGNALSDVNNLNPDRSSIMFELGIFEPGFSPSLQNASLWESNWTAFPALTVTGTSPNQVTSIGQTSLAANGEFGGTFTFGVGGGVTDTTSANVTYPEGRQIYIWGFNTQTVGGTEVPEWLLFTSLDASDSTTSDTNWVVPDASLQTHTVQAPQFNAPSSGTNVVFGRRFDETGAGIIDSTATLTEFGDFQFARVPEPSSALLILIGFAGCLSTRKR